MSLPRLQHRLLPMLGRDPGEAHRVATPLELFFDLVFVVGFGQAAGELAHAIAEGHADAGIGAFAFTAFAVTWAWAGFAWFASAFDTDDWAVRIAAMVMMVGVVLIAFGVHPIFASFIAETPLDNGLAVAGYIVMRLALLALWIRVAVQDPTHRLAALLQIGSIAIAQLGWVLVLVLRLPLWATVIVILPLYAIEFTGPTLAQRLGAGFPWHPHHIAERYGLLIIITLGEVIVGSVTAISAAVAESGWSVGTAALAVAGVALAFALWWAHFLLPSGDVLSRRRSRSVAWGYSSLVIFAALTAVGAGLHVAALAIDDEAGISTVGVALAVAIPVGIDLVALFAVYSIAFGEIDPFHVPLMFGSLVPLGGAVVAASIGLPEPVWLGLVVLAPVIVIVGYEAVGHRHQAEALQRLAAEDGDES